MGRKILVSYASWAGSTREVAEAIAERLGEEGSVDVRPARDVDDISSYGAVVLGTAVRAGRPNRAAKAFVARHCEALAGLPVACFVVCLTMKEDTPANRKTSRGFLDSVVNACPGMKPVDIGLFAGAVPSGKEALAKQPFWQRLIMGAMKSLAGDYRDWAAIERWADSVLPLLDHEDSVA